MGWVVNATPVCFTPGKVPVSMYSRWVGSRAGLDWCGKSGPHQDSIPGPSSRYRVAVPTELSRATARILARLISVIKEIFSSEEETCIPNQEVTAEINRTAEW
jgi:hypothetical protein